MKIETRDAVSHIFTSLENVDQAIWHDDDADITWSVMGIRDTFVFEFTDADDNTTTQFFRLVEDV